MRDRETPANRIVKMGQWRSLGRVLRSNRRKSKSGCAEFCNEQRERETERDRDGQRWTEKREKKKKRQAERTHRVETRWYKTNRRHHTIKTVRSDMSRWYECKKRDNKKEKRCSVRREKRKRDGNRERSGGVTVRIDVMERIDKSKQREQRWYTDVIGANVCIVWKNRLTKSERRPRINQKEWRGVWESWHQTGDPWEQELMWVTVKQIQCMRCGDFES